MGGRNGDGDGQKRMEKNMGMAIWRWLLVPSPGTLSIIFSILVSFIYMELVENTMGGVW